MKLLIDTNWFAMIQDLPYKKQKDVLCAILDYPNKDSDTNLWKKVIKPSLEKEKIIYENKCENLKRANAQKTKKKITDSDTVSNTDSDTVSPSNSNIYNIYNNNSRNLIPDINTQDNNKLSGISNNIYTTRANEEKTKENFDIFWESYTPVKASDGYVVAKGSKKVSFEKYSRIIKSGVKPEDILKGLKAYIDFCQRYNRLTCGVPVFLNQERWKDEYNTPTVIAQTPPPRMSFKEMKEYQNNIEIQKILNGEK